MDRKSVREPGCSSRSYWPPSAVALVRLHATGGYCTVRHGLVPGMILTLAAASGLTWLMSKVSIPGRWLGLATRTAAARSRRLAALIAMLVVIPNIRSLGPPNAGSILRLPFHRRLARPAYRPDRAGPRSDRLVALLQRAAWVHPSPTSTKPQPTPALRWIVARKPHVDGPLELQPGDSRLIADREPVALDSTRGQGRSGADPHLRSPQPHFPAIDQVQPERHRNQTALSAGTSEGMIQKQVAAPGGWGRRPQGDAPRPEASALGVRWLLPARPQPPTLVTRE